MTYKAQRDIRHHTNTGTLHDGSPKAWAVYDMKRNQRIACIQETVGVAWDQDTIAENAAKLFAQAPTLYDLLCEALPMVEEADPDPALYKPGYLNGLIKRIKAAIEGAAV
jgi:hypothetical protein